MADISIKKAALINAASKYTTLLLHLVINAILARLLTPNEFGTVAVITVFTTLFSVIADMGLGTAVIQNKELTKSDINNIFSFTVYLSVILYVVFAIFSIPLSIFYKDKIYIPLGLLLAVSILFNTLNMIPNALLMKEKKFVSVGLRNVLVCIISSTLAIVFALLGFGCYTLVLQSLMNGAMIFIWNYKLSKPKFIFRFSMESIKKVRRFSTFQFLFSIINYFARNIDNLLTSKFMGAAMLGYYDKAYKLMLYPVNNLTHVITPVLHPILSDHQKDYNYIYEKYIKIIKLLSLIGIFITSFCLCASEEIITIVFGSQWVKAIPCFKLLSLAVWAQMLLATTGSIFQSIGKTKLLFITGCCTSALTIGFIIEGLIEKNIESVARNVALSYNIQFIFSFYMLINRGMGFKLHKFLLKVLPDLFILTVLILAGYFAGMVTEKTGISNIIASFAVKLAIMGVCYLILLFVTKQYKYILDFLRRK